VRWGEANRVAGVERRAGGKGVNVARLLHQLGEDTLVTGFCGGPTGEAVHAELESVGLPWELVPIAGETRRTTTVFAGSGTDATGFWEPGPTVAPEEWQRFGATFASLVPRADAVVLSGSLPAGVPPDAYASLARAAAETGVSAILDTSGEPLRLGLAGQPAIVKPNADELAEAAAHAAPAASPTAAGAGIFAVAQRLRAAGAEAVVVSLGDEGLCAVTAERSWRARPPEAVAGNPTGAGDAVVAALAAGRRRPWPERLADAVALSAASVHAPVAGSFDAAAYQRYRELVQVD
jgi:1-phosphofructokinase family hexose kinase